jgi:chromosome segregation protein
MQVDRLRLVGFKSFVDATELAIEPGLTGVVGPNGCGKSNLVEALRWVMGETSAKRLRGGEMDDVIFAGTAARPTRNIAEVALTIDNSARDAPFAFNDREEIEVVRRIERGGGSTYRVNGREVRARDVQLLFADAASGAHSGAMVSQGRIGALIDAKPAERRLLLEEAAGTAGLHARRHETELKLSAAEDNLTRLDDVVATIEAQFETLKKQARQAQRYRRLAEHIRRTEALLFRARWLAAEIEAERMARELRATERAVAEATERTLAEGRARENAEAALPPLRLADAAAAAELQRLTHARGNLEQELQRVLAARTETERRLAQLVTDLEREDAHLAEAEAALGRLLEESRVLEAAEAENGPAREVAAARLHETTASLAAAEAALQRETEAAAAVEARRATLDRRRRELADRCARQEARRAESERQRAALAVALVAPEAVAIAATALAEAEGMVEHCRAAVEAGENEITTRLGGEQAALDAARQVDTQLARLKAEAKGLRTLLAPAPNGGGGPPVLTALRVAPGFEAAIGAVFQDELSAPLADAAHPAASRFWVNLAGIEDGASLPDGARPLAEAVTAPPALARSLARAGWVDNEEAGRSLQPSLAPGQRLVDREGRLWRWDGFTSIAPGPSSATEHLRHINRLAVLECEITKAEAEGVEVEQRAAAARAERQRASEYDRLTRVRLRDAEAALARARAVEAELTRRALTTETRLAAAVDILEKVSGDLAEARAQAEEAERDLAALPEPNLARAALDRARAAAAASRRRDAEARAAIERLTHEGAHRRERLSSIDAERRSWRKRGEDAAAQRAALAGRRNALDAEIAGLAARPAGIAAESEALGTAIAAAAASCRRSADALALGETRLRQSVEGSRLADQALGEARERLARFEVLRDGAMEALARLAREISERLDAAPEALGELAGLTADQVAADEAPADAAETAARLDRLMRERDGMGPVNLLAESEAAEAEMRITDLRRERADLTEAIARLRRGIATLDHEVRQRLIAAFGRINGHFTELFTRLFGGGKAYLALVDDEDPLAAGLEIMASPPGKRLQSLSLLSGGEQTLTALALLFAAFLTNPAPVCVLDEVDAPLDDANVDRFCSLVGEIADAAGTRFLVVTHHRITMARVDRLFGVTMAERGVSQLVSVDLARAARLRQTA